VRSQLNARTLGVTRLQDGTAVFLLLFFRERLGLAFAPERELSDFRAGGTRYRDTGAGFMTSHYDRLTDAAGRLSGFVIWGVPADAGVAVALAALPPRPYIKCIVTTGEGAPLAFAIYLAGGVTPDPDSTGEQAFGGQSFVGEGGEFALSIDLNYLLGDGPRAATDVNAIRGAPVEWLALSEVQAHDA
jgi:hypothetical protein